MRQIGDGPRFDMHLHLFALVQEIDTKVLHVVALNAISETVNQSLLSSVTQFNIETFFHKGNSDRLESSGGRNSASIDSTCRGLQDSPSTY